MIFLCVFSSFGNDVLCNPRPKKRVGVPSIVFIIWHSCFEVPSQLVCSFSQEEPDSYDKLVSEMVFEMRARPSDRTKTPEEIAEEEKERLEQLEVRGTKFLLFVVSHASYNSNWFTVHYGKHVHFA